jgi:hypothetical protein
MDNPNDNFEQEEYNETPTLDELLSRVNYPEFLSDPNDVAFNAGVEQGSAILGFASVLNNLGLSEDSLMKIILTKINSEFQLEALKAQFDAEERIAEIGSKQPINVNGGGYD